MAVRKANVFTPPAKLIFTKYVQELTFVKMLPLDTHRSQEVYLYQYTLDEIKHPNGMPIKLGTILPLMKDGITRLIEKGTVKSEY